MEIFDRPVGEDAPRFLQIARALTDEIRSGRLARGTRLPGSRTLAAELGVHRNTVLAAYSELAAEGWIETTRAKGTFVSDALPDARERCTSARRSMADKPGFALPPAPPLRDVSETPAGAIVMSGGTPDLRLLPVREITRAYRRALSKRGRALLGYGDPRGEPRLRAAIADMLNKTRGLSVDADDVLVTRGSQMALDLVARTLLRPGDAVAVEALGYPPAWQALMQSGAELTPVPVDAEGIDVEALAALCEKRRLSAVYLTPHHQYPSTVTLTAPRRLALMELARRHRLAIIEDDYDHEFHYEWRPVQPLASADPGGHVVYIGTLSKILAPGLRLGYLVAPRKLLEHATLRRRYIDRQGDLALEHAIADLMEDGELARHARRMRRVYLARRNALVAGLRARLGDALSFEVPPGGMALWARASAGIDVDAWSARAREQCLVVHPGRAFAFDRRARPCFRLGFAALDEREIGEAIGRLARAL